MKREERDEFNFIKRRVKSFTIGFGTTVTIRTDASTEYKHALDTLYTSLNFHPASIKVDSHLYDDKERIIYIYSRTWESNGISHTWEELYTTEELTRFKEALEALR